MTHAWRLLHQKGLGVMDPVSIALITAIGAGITESITDATKTSLAAGYMALKKRLLEKISSRHPKVSQALTELEVTPTSLARQAVLVEEITAAQIPKDAELMALAQKLLSQVQQIPSGSQIISHVQNSAVSNSGTAITYNIQVLQLIPVAEISCEQAILPVLRCWHA